MNFQFSTFSSLLHLALLVGCFFTMALLRSSTAVIIVHECWMSFFPPACRLVSLCRLRRWGGLEWHDKKWTSHSQCRTTRKMSRNGNKISTSLPLFLSFFYSSRCCRYDVVAQRRTQSFTILPLSRSPYSSTDSSWDLIKFYFKRQTMMSWEEIAAAVKNVNGVEIFFQFSPICKLLRYTFIAAAWSPLEESMYKNYM